MLPVVDTTRTCALEWMRKAVVSNSDFVYSTTGIPASSPMTRIWNMTKICAIKAKQSKTTTVKTGKWNLILWQVGICFDRRTNDYYKNIWKENKNFENIVLTILKIIATADPCYTKFSSYGGKKEKPLALRPDWALWEGGAKNFRPDFPSSLGWESLHTHLIFALTITVEVPGGSLCQHTCWH